MALASIAILTFADPISHLVGKCFGRIPSILDRRKNIEGHVVGFLASSAIALFFVSPLLAFAGSFIAVTFESMIIEVQKMKLDDNLIIPLAAGTAMYLLSVWI
jgi:dolichol kinase